MYSVLILFAVTLFFSLLRLIVCNTAVLVMQKCPCNWYVPRAAGVPHGWRRGQPSGLAAREARGNLANFVLPPRDPSRVSILDAVGALREAIFFYFAKCVVWPAPNRFCFLTPVTESENASASRMLRQHLSPHRLDTSASRVPCSDRYKLLPQVASRDQTWRRQQHALPLACGKQASSPGLQHSCHQARAFSFHY